MGDLDLHWEEVEAICTLAEMPTSSETPGVVSDPEMDTLIMAARVIKKREGISVEQYLG